jgi:hypothetical protein
MNSVEKQYSPHQMDLPTHNNANTGTLCLNPVYPWFHQHKHSQIFSLSLLAWKKKGSDESKCLMKNTLVNISPQSDC